MFTQPRDLLYNKSLHTHCNEQESSTQQYMSPWTHKVLGPKRLPQILVSGVGQTDMASSEESPSSTSSTEDTQQLYPAVPMYAPHNIRGLKVGEKKLWCACGLSKKQPWCDGSHVGTGIKPIKWTVTKNQVLHQICGCKYTRDPPYCDATHTNLPCDVIERKEGCANRTTHCSDLKLCTGCGWVPDF